MKTPKNQSNNGIVNKKYFIYFKLATFILTNFKAGENEQYTFLSKTFILHDPKCPKLKKMLPHILDLRKNPKLMYHLLWMDIFNNHCLIRDIIVQFKCGEELNQYVKSAHIQMINQLFQVIHYTQGYMKIRYNMIVKSFKNVIVFQDSKIYNSIYNSIESVKHFKNVFSNKVKTT